MILTTPKINHTFELEFKCFEILLMTYFMNQSLHDLVDLLFFCYVFVCVLFFCYVIVCVVFDPC